MLARHRTKQVEPSTEQEAAALADSVADEDDGLGSGDLARFPFKPYCRDCGRDTTLTAYDDATT